MNHHAFSKILILVILIVLIVGGFTGLTGATITGNVVSEDDVEGIFMNYLGQVGANTNYVEITDISSEKGLYKISFDYQGQPYPVSFYLTKDGSIIGTMSEVKVDSSQTDTSASQTQPTEIPKSDKPVVELFVMTHCPYGTQAEKGFIPAILELGDKIDAKIEFVHYFLHEPEKTETPIQVCIREEQEEKFLPYLKCFLEDGDSDRCLSETGVNSAKLNICLEEKADEYYATDSELSEIYGVRGSPTLVINGVQSNAGRSAQAYLDGICDAFNDAPEECSLSLDSDNPSPGFGYGTTSGIANAQC